MCRFQDIAKLVFCLGLMGCQTGPEVASHQPVPRPETAPQAARRVEPPATARAQASETPPRGSEGTVVRLQLSAGELRERVEDTVQPLARLVALPAPPDPNRVPALQRELARQLAGKIETLRGRIQEMNSRMTAPPVPPGALPLDAGQSIAETPTQSALRIGEGITLLDAKSVEAPAAPGDPPPASQREINRLITQCLGDLEKEVRELGAQVRVINSPGE